MSSITKNWTEEHFIAQLRQLDNKFGTRASEAPIKLCKSNCYLGKYLCTNEQLKIGDIPKGFEFSTVFYNSDNFPEEAAIDCILHEYAHYYAHLHFFSCSHNWLWKKSCVIVGARPERLYSSRYWGRYLKNNETVQSQFNIGTEIEHDKFGRGIVTDIDVTNSKQPIVTVDFEGGVSKRLIESWVVTNCSINY